MPWTPEYRAAVLVVVEHPLTHRPRHLVRYVPCAPLRRLQPRLFQVAHHSKFHLRPVAPPPQGLVADVDAVSPRPGSWSSSKRDAQGFSFVVLAHPEDHGRPLPVRLRRAGWSPALSRRRGDVASRLALINHPL